MNKGELTRQRILQEAATLFNQRGFAGCSIQDVMDATGLEKGGLYRHFASKEELAAEAFRYARANAIKVRTENLSQISGAVNQLRYVIQRFAEGPSVMPGGCPLMNTAIDADDGNPMLRRLALEGIQEWKAKLQNIVEEGIKREEIRSYIESRMIANSIIATLEGALMISRLEGNKTAMQDARATLESVLDGLTPPRPRVSRIRR